MAFSSVMSCGLLTLWYFKTNPQVGYLELGFCEASI